MDGGLDEIIKAAATSAAGRPIFPSEGGQDRFLWLAHFQYLKRPIVYADFGSNNAVFTSNTFFLDQCLGASGVCVEANPRLKDAYHWRSCSLVNTCLSDAAHQVEFAFQDGVSTRSGILKDNKSYKHSKRKPALVVNMTCTTGAQVLAASSLTHIDYLDLDAEGHELAILKGIDWEAVTIDIILCEANDQQVPSFLKALGYRPHGKVHYDDIYLRAGFTLGQPAPALQNRAVTAGGGLVGWAGAAWSDGLGWLKHLGQLNGWGADGRLSSKAQTEGRHIKSKPQCVPVRIGGRLVVAVRLLSDCCRIAVGLLSGCCLIAV